MERFRISNIEQGTSKFEIRHSIFDIRWRLDALLLILSIGPLSAPGGLAGSSPHEAAATQIVAKPRDALAAGQPTRYMIVVTGGELLAGTYQDGHTYFLTQTLRPL
ncbi:MAG: hypothetical protein MUO33_12355, partial [Sedimentisphaerales bacterium]|nr:hypothetical protein [Sedimentisphaerales bacterium]